MRIFNITDLWNDGTALLRAQVRPFGAREPMQLWYRFDGLDGPLEATADPFIVAMLPSCMYNMEPCRIDGEASQSLVANLRRAQDVLSSWYEFLSPIPIDLPHRAAPAPEVPSSGVACCFSGDVDSWYSLLKHQPRATHLLLVRGFDIGLEDDARWNAVREDAATVAGRLGKRLITCETNLRDVADRGKAVWGQPFPGDFWGQCLQGAAMASCALSLQRTVGEVIVPAQHEFRTLKPWGSSPRLDHHWSNGAVAVRHDGCEADRLDKVRHLASVDLALQTLRVCHRDAAHANCGRCETCVRTMLQLHLCGALGRAGAFQGYDPFRMANRLDVPSSLAHHYDAMLHEAYRVDDRNVVRAIEKIMGQRFSVERTLAMAVRRARRLSAAYAMMERSSAFVSKGTPAH